MLTKLVTFIYKSTSWKVPRSGIFKIKICVEFSMSVDDTYIRKNKTGKLLQYCTSKINCSHVISSFFSEPRSALISFSNQDFACFGISKISDSYLYKQNH